MNHEQPTNEQIFTDTTANGRVVVANAGRVNFKVGKRTQLNECPCEDSDVIHIGKATFKVTNTSSGGIRAVEITTGELIILSYGAIQSIGAFFAEVPVLNPQGGCGICGTAFYDESQVLNRGWSKAPTGKIFCPACSSTGLWQEAKRGKAQESEHEICVACRDVHGRMTIAPEDLTGWVRRRQGLWCPECDAELAGMLG